MIERFHFSRDDVDPELGVLALFLSVPRKDLIAVKVLLESFEGIGVIRSQQPRYTPERSLIVMLLVPDFLDCARRLLAELSEMTAAEVVAPSAAMLAELKAELLGGP